VSSSRTDPFEIGKSLKIPTGLSRSQKAGRKIKNAAKNAYGNATSKPSPKMSRTKEPVDEHGRMTSRPYSEDGPTAPFATKQKFGQKKPRGPKAEGAGIQSFGNGMLAGAGAGAVAGYGVHGGQTRQDYKTLKQHRRVNKAFKPPKRPHLITDMGTNAGKPRVGDRDLFSAKGLAAGTALGGTLTYGASAGQRKEQRAQLNRVYRQQKKKTAVTKAATLERYTPSKSERRKMRATNAAHAGVGTAAAAAATPAALKGVAQLAGNGSVRLKTLKPSAKNLKIAAGAGLASAALNASGKYDKKQFRVKKGLMDNDPFEISKSRRDRAADGAATAAIGGGGYLAAGAAGKKVSAHHRKATRYGLSQNTSTKGDYIKAGAKGLKTKAGAAGLGLMAAGTSTNIVQAQREKRSGSLTPVSVAKSADPFEIRKWKDKSPEAQSMRTNAALAAGGGYFALRGKTPIGRGAGLGAAIGGTAVALDANKKRKKKNAIIKYADPFNAR